MRTWVRCELTVMCSKHAELHSFRQDANGPEPLWFDSVFHAPGFKFSEDITDWRKRFWGCETNPANVMLFEEIETRNRLRYLFDVIGGEPSAFFDMVSKSYPGLTFELEWEERWTNGKARFKNGKISSHYNRKD